MTATHAYVSRRPCGHPVGLCVDDPAHPRDTAKFVASEVRGGNTVERVTIEEARVIGVEYCACNAQADLLHSDDMKLLLAELRELRGLLATPFDDDIQPPAAQVGRHRPFVLFVDAGVERAISIEYAIQLGAGLIRAALEAKERL